MVVNRQVFGEDATCVTQIKEWFNRFKDGRTSADSKQRCGLPKTALIVANVERVRRVADRRSTEEVGVSEDLNMKRAAAKFVPKLLSPEQ
ncbi:HTH_48 domain-containing protein [Trichonephila clavipes]|nr:HTH_48 domain-containing protein [Trichonephila clavipes]